MLVAAILCNAAVADDRAEYETRLAAMTPGDHDAAIELATWSVERELFDEADGLYRAILDADATHELAYQALWELSRGRTPRESDTLDRAMTRLPDEFRLRETSHFVVLSDADPAWVRKQGDRLDRAYDRFIRFALRLRLRPLPLTHKLVAVVFDERSDFDAFAGRDGAPVSPRLAGYYQRRHDWLVFYHAESGDNIARARRQLQDMADEIDAIRRQSRRARLVGRDEEARDLAEDLDQRIDHLNEQELRLNVIAHRQIVSVTVHEAIHQLMFHTHVQATDVDQPLWLSEGLATAFETDNTRADFGPGREYAPRREMFWHLMDNERLMPLRQLITATGAVHRSDGDAVNVVYHQSYALVTWMSQHRRRELREYIDLLNAQPPGHGSPQRRLELFEQAFGNIDRLEQRWLRHEQEDS